MSITTFSLPAGKTCPGALKCRSSAVRDDQGHARVKDSNTCEFRCFAASDEARYPNVFDSRRSNLEGLRNAKNMFKILNNSLNTKNGGLFFGKGNNKLNKNKKAKEAKVVRIHVSGDFYSQRYFDSWVEVAKNNPDKLFYAYTKSLLFWVKRLKAGSKNKVSGIPGVPNLVLTASAGGKHDALIKKFNLRSACVVMSEDEAKNLGLKIDTDDSLAMKNGSDFALLLHGTQPKTA